MNGARAVPFLLDGDDFWASGEYATFRGGVPLEQVIEALRSSGYAHRLPRVWSRTAMDFVPI